MARLGDARLAARLRGQLTLPVMAGPMFLVSGPDLVVASSKAGVIGSFPTPNARTAAILDEWLARIGGELAAVADAAPFAANLIVHPSNPRFADDLAVVVNHRVATVIASVGNPTPAIEKVKGYGGIVFSDVASLKHARRAAEAGVDGLILLCAGCGGNTGWLSPFAFLGAVREFFDGPIVLAGAISRGRLIHVAEELGADLVYIGTSFIATRESMASDEYRAMLVESGPDDITLTAEVTGIPANMLRPSLERAGFKPSAKHGGFDLMKELDTLRAWRDIWSAGHGVGDVKAVGSVAELIADLRADYEAARGRREERRGGRSMGRRDKPEGDVLGLPSSRHPRTRSEDPASAPVTG